MGSVRVAPIRQPSEGGNAARTLTAEAVVTLAHRARRVTGTKPGVVASVESLDLVQTPTARETLRPARPVGAFDRARNREECVRRRRGAPHLTLLAPPAAVPTDTVYLQYALADGIPSTGDMSAPTAAPGGTAEAPPGEGAQAFLRFSPGHTVGAPLKCRSIRCNGSRAFRGHCGAHTTLESALHARIACNAKGALDSSRRHHCVRWTRSVRAGSFSGSAC